MFANTNRQHIFDVL